MGFKDLRHWLETLDSAGELKRVTVPVDWDLEITEICRRLLAERGPAVLFENIKGYRKTWCRRLFCGGLGTRGRICMMLGIPTDTSFTDIVQEMRRRLRQPVKPRYVKSGPVKENIINRDNVDLFQLPVPRWHQLDGGRYINTWCGVVTMHPETGEHNVGLYRGMLLSKSKIGVLLVPAQGWGAHYAAYQHLGKPMPVSIVYGWDPSLPVMAGAPLSGVAEYEAMGAIRQEPVPLVECESSGLYVPASAEIVVEGTISPDPATYEVEGPFGEWTGYYGEARRRPVIEVQCVTYRDDPVYRGSIEGVRPGIINEDAVVSFVTYSALIWNILEAQDIPGIVDVASGPITVVKIRKTYQGQAKHVAAALWGSRLAINSLKVVMVVDEDEDIDIHNPRALQWAMGTFIDPARSLISFPMEVGSTLDVGLDIGDRDELRYGVALQNKLLIDATVDWTIHPVRKEWGGRRIPPACTEAPDRVAELVRRRWTEYGF